MEENKIYPEQPEGQDGSTGQDPVPGDIVQEVQSDVSADLGEPNASQTVDSRSSAWQQDGLSQSDGQMSQDPVPQSSNHQSQEYQRNGYQDQDYSGGSYQNNTYQGGYPADQNGVYQNSSYQNGGYQNSNYQNNGYQDNSYQSGNYQNGGYQDNSYQSSNYQNGGYQDNSYQSSNYQNNGYQNSSYQGGSYQNGTYSGNAYQSYGTNYQQYNTTPSYPNGQMELEEPVKVSEWVLALVLMIIPCVNIIMMFVWAFSSTEKKSKSNFFKAYLIFFGISMGVMLLIWLAVVIFALML